MRPGPIEPQKARKVRQRNRAPAARSSTGAEASRIARTDVDSDSIGSNEKPAHVYRGSGRKPPQVATDGPGGSVPAPFD
jgi:hypothetical protein